MSWKITLLWILLGMVLQGSGEIEAPSIVRPIPKQYISVREASRIWLNSHFKGYNMEYEIESKKQIAEMLKVQNAIQNVSKMKIEAVGGWKKVKVETNAFGEWQKLFYLLKNNSVVIATLSEDRKALSKIQTARIESKEEIRCFDLQRISPELIAIDCQTKSLEIGKSYFYFVNMSSLEVSRRETGNFINEYIKDRHIKSIRYDSNAIYILRAVMFLDIYNSLKRGDCYIEVYRIREESKEIEMVKMIGKRDVRMRRLAIEDFEVAEEQLYIVNSEGIRESSLIRINGFLSEKPVVEIESTPYKVRKIEVRINRKDVEIVATGSKKFFLME